MANIIEIIFKGRNDASNEIADVKSGLDGVSDSAKKGGAAMDVAMGVLASTQLQRFGDAVGQVFNTMINSAIEAERVAADLETVLKSTGGAAGVTAEGAKELAGELARLTLFEDDAILAGETILLQFTKIGKETLPDATKAMLDLSQRMGIGIPNAAKLIGKAMEGEFIGLKRFGIFLDEQAEKTIEHLFETGKAAEAQALILEELNKRIGGSAEAAADTFGGAMSQLKKEWGEFQEALGTSVVENEMFKELIQSITELLRGLIDAFSNLSDGAQLALVGLFGLFALLAKMAPALISLKVLFGAGGLAGVVTVAKGAIVGLAGVIGGLSAPVLLLIAAIGVLIASLAILGPQAKKTLDMLFAIFKAVLQRIKFEIDKFGASLIEWARTKFGEVGAAIVSGIWEGIKTAWPLLTGNIPLFLANLLVRARQQIGAHSPSDLWADKIGLPMAQGIGIGFERGLQTVSPTMSAALVPQNTFGIRGGGAIQVGTVQVYGELSPEAQRRMRQQAEDISYNSIRLATRRARG